MAAMAKKKQAKKHKFKYAEPSTLVGTRAPVELPVGTSQRGMAAPRSSVSTATTRDFSYVGADLRRIAVFGVSLVLLEFVLWFLFGHTGLGNSVYNFVKV